MPQAMQVQKRADEIEVGDVVVEHVGTFEVEAVTVDRGLVDVSGYMTIPAGVCGPGSRSYRDHDQITVQVDTAPAQDRAQQLRDEADQAETRRAESWERSDTDGFVSQWASGITAQEKRAQADIIDNGGTAEFPGLFVDGVRVKAKIIPTKFGVCWALLDEAGSITGFQGRGERSLKKNGYEERDETAPAWATIQGSGTGLAGAASCRVVTYRTDDGYPADAVVIA